MNTRENCFIFGDRFWRVLEEKKKSVQRGRGGRFWIVATINLSLTIKRVQKQTAPFIERKALTAKIINVPAKKWRKAV